MTVELRTRQSPRSRVAAGALILALAAAAGGCGGDATVRYEIDSRGPTPAITVRPRTPTVPRPPTATPAPITPDPTATRTDTRTPTGTPTFTPTPTPRGSVCGDGVIGAGERCCISQPGASPPACDVFCQPAAGCEEGYICCPPAVTCPGDCVVGPCTVPTPATLRTYNVNLAYPPGRKPESVTILLGYKSSKVSLPGSGSTPASRFTSWPSNTARGFNDLNYAVRVVATRAVGFDVGRLFTVNFDGCSGQSAPTAAEFGCTVEGCGSATGAIADCTCSVSVP